MHALRSNTARQTHTIDYSVSFQQVRPLFGWLERSVGATMTGRFSSFLFFFAFFRRLLRNPNSRAGKLALLPNELSFLTEERNYLSLLPSLLLLRPTPALFFYFSLTFFFSFSLHRWKGGGKRRGHRPVFASSTDSSMKRGCAVSSRWPTPARVSNYIWFPNFVESLFSFQRHPGRPIAVSIYFYFSFSIYFFIFCWPVFESVRLVARSRRWANLRDWTERQKGDGSITTPHPLLASSWARASGHLLMKMDDESTAWYHQSAIPNYLCVLGVFLVSFSLSRPSLCVSILYFSAWVCVSARSNYKYMSCVIQQQMFPIHLAGH